MEDLNLDEWRLPHQEEEDIVDLFSDLKINEEKLMYQIGDLAAKAESRKNLKLEVPRFDGSALMFHTWLKEFEASTFSLSDERRTAIVSAITAN